MNAAKLKGIMAERGKTQKEVAEMIGISPVTFYRKLKSGTFGLDEVDAMITGLNIENPAEIFLTNR